MKVSSFIFIGVVLLFIAGSLTAPAYSSTMIAVSQTDTTTGVYIFDENGTSQGYRGLNGAVSDIGYDTEGNLYSYTSTGLWKYNGVNNVMISSMYAPVNYGGDIALSPLGVIAVSQTDTSSGVNFFDLSGRSLGGYGLNGAVSDIQYDSAGNLYSYTSTGVWMYDGATNSRISGNYAPTNYGGDIALSSSGVIALSQTDTSMDIEFLDSRGAPAGRFTASNYVSDIAYDSAGNLYSLTSNGLWKYDGVTNTRLAGLDVPTNYGGDVAIYSSTVAAEPVSTILFIAGGVVLGFNRFRNGKKVV